MVKVHVLMAPANHAHVVTTPLPPYRLVIPMQSQADALSGQYHAHQMHSQASGTGTVVCEDLA